jgi:hypothetical protein
MFMNTIDGRLVLLALDRLPEFGEGLGLIERGLGGLRPAGDDGHGRQRESAQQTATGCPQCSSFCDGQYR